MSIVRTCDICKMSHQSMVGGAPVNDVRRYTLRRETDQSRTAGVRTNRQQQSAGGIDICASCWEAICKPRMNPKKSHSKTSP